EVSYSMDLYADSIKAVMNQEKIDKAILIGHSMGVSVARQFYRRYPENTQALVMVDSFLKFNVTPEMEKGMGNFVASFKKENSEAFIRMFLSNMFVKESPNEIKEWVITQMLAAPTHVRTSSIENLWKRAVWIDDTIDVPVLVIRAKTAQLSPDTAENVKNVAANSKLEIWEGVGHFLHLEKPDKFNQSLMTFFKEQGFIE
ncbi:MAG: alpha/beta hydrolase, partial [Acidobacteria bacterium]|nr:alpha/beta hydrolase [Acidobacteriota bacterium]